MKTTHTIRVELKLEIATDAEVGPATIAIALAEALAQFNQTPLGIIGDDINAEEFFVNSALALDVELAA